MKVFNSILETIGKTSLIKLENLYKNQKVEIYGKFESLNPGGSIKDRICLNMINKAEEEKLISLRGTLVPATTINKTISKIPLLGKILVGDKTGEGVFGVSFKIKGPPKDLETSVNPIKTLTPRFITRTLEKIKKN